MCGSERTAVRVTVYCCAWRRVRPAEEYAMTNSTLQAVGRNAVEAVTRLFRREGDDAGVAVPIDVTRLKAQLRTAQELAMPGFMSLRPVRNGAEVVDFEWEFASVAATRLLGGVTAPLIGRRLVEAFAGRAGRAEVFAQYRRVIEIGSARAVHQMVESGPAVDMICHAALCLHDSVAVTLTNLSAVRRVRALELEIDARSLMAV